MILYTMSAERAQPLGDAVNSSPRHSTLRDDLVQIVSRISKVSPSSRSLATILSVRLERELHFQVTHHARNIGCYDQVTWVIRPVPHTTRACALPCRQHALEGSVTYNSYQPSRSCRRAIYVTGILILCCRALYNRLPQSTLAVAIAYQALE